MQNDAELYTGIDQEPTGQFQNEIVDKDVKAQIQEQERQIKELTPKIEDLLKVIDAEIDQVMSIDRFATATTQPEDNVRAELQAAALYKNYLGTLKTKFVLALREAKKGKK